MLFILLFICLVADADTHHGIYRVQLMAMKRLRAASFRVSMVAMAGDVAPGFFPHERLLHHLGGSSMILLNAVLQSQTRLCRWDG